MNALRFLATFLSVLLFSAVPAKAEGIVSGETVHIVIAADLSSSMFMSGNSDEQKQTAALGNFFAGYEKDFCVPVVIDFAPWGSTHRYAVHANLNSSEDFVRLANAIMRESVYGLGSTNPEVGINNALRIFAESKAYEKILIFSTNGLPSEQSGVGPIAPIPNDITVYGISFGTQDVKKYVEVSIVRESGSSYHIGSSEEYEAVLETIFARIRAVPCLG